MDFIFYVVALVARILGIDFADFIGPSTIIGWSLLLTLPLTGIDRRDVASFSMYTMFITTGGILLLIIVPNSIMLSSETLLIHVYICVGMISLATVRWVFVKPYEELKGMLLGEKKEDRSKK